MKSAKRHVTLAALALAVVVPSIMLVSSASEPECKEPLVHHLNECVDPLVVCEGFSENTPSFCED